jgi:hypothetical protein
MPRDLLLAFALGGASALAHMAMLLGGAGALIFALLAPLPVFYAGLAMGPRSALIAGAVGTAVSLALGLWTAFGFLLEVALGPFLLTGRAVLFRAMPDGKTEWYPVGWLFGWLAGLAGGALIALHVWFLGSEGGLTGALEQTLRAYLEQLRDAGVLRELGLQQDTAAVAATMARIMPGAAGAVWMLVMIANGALAQGLALRFGKAIRPVARLVNMELPIWLLIALPAALVLSFLDGPIGALGASLLPVAMVPVLFQGCAVVHVLARRTPLPGFAVGFFYALMLVFGALVLVVILLGLAEHWLKVRRRVLDAAG